MKTYKISPKKNFEFNYIHDSYHELHNHNYYEFAIVTKGSMIHHINGIDKLINANTLLLIRPHDCHYIQAINDKEVFELFNFDVASKFFTSFFELTNNDLLVKLNNADIIEFPIPSTSSKYFSNFIHKTATIYQNNNYPEEILTPIFLDLMSVIFHHYQNPIQSKNYSPVVNNMMDMLEDKNNFSLTIEQIAKKANYSYAHINRLFKKETGITISKYFSQIRLEYGKRLIETTSDSIEDISLKIGFSSLSHFTKLFNIYYGTTPAKHRKIWNNMN